MIGVLSDAHGNIDGFRLAIERLERLGASRFLFLGDAVGYIPSIEVLQELQKMGNRVKCIKGNHEDMILRRCLNPVSELIYQHQRVIDQMTESLVSFVFSWPDHLILDFNGENILFVHGGPDDYTNQYVYPDTDLSNCSLKEKIVFMGHTHYPFIKTNGKTLFVNVGSCGLPRDDGRYGAAALFNPIDYSVKIIRFRIDLATKVAFENYAPVHSSVKALSHRSSDELLGEIA